MNKKSFLLGIVTGIVLTFVGLLVIGSVYHKTDASDRVTYLENPTSYENKSEAYFKVFQVFENSALATEASDWIGGDVLYHGTTVLVLGQNYYSDQILTIKNPQRIGTYSYTTNGGISKTVPVIDGEID